jgi:hypothetical protein
VYALMHWSLDCVETVAVAENFVRS